MEIKNYILCKDTKQIHINSQSKVEKEEKGNKQVKEIESTILQSSYCGLLNVHNIYTPTKHKDKLDRKTRPHLNIAFKSNNFNTNRTQVNNKTLYC